MALSPELLQFKSSGVYRLEFDKSQVASIPAEQIRLVVGFSKEGPFNTPVFVSDTGFFQNVFGPVDRTLERKGSYFHRTALAALERGPILALNLLRLNNDLESASPDIVDYQTFSTASTEVNPVEKTALYSGFYNKDKFWFPEDLSFLNNIGTVNTGVIQFVNLKQSPVTVFVRKAQNVKAFDILAKEWYGAGNVPAFMSEFDYISDFMIDVFVINGDFSNYAQLAIDPLYGPYFDATKGLLKSSYEAFLALPSVSVIAQYGGCLIPDFIDLNGNNLFIQDLINFDTASTGLLAAVNKSLFDGDEIISGTETGIDLVGHNIENKTNTDPSFTSIKFLSYDRSVRDDFSYLNTTGAEVGIDLNTATDISFYLTSAGSGSASLTPPVVTGGDLPSSLGANIANYVIKVNVDHPQYDTLIKNKLSINIAGQGQTQRVVGSYALVTDGGNYAWAPIVSLTEASGFLYVGVSIEVANWEIAVESPTSAGNQIFLLTETNGSEWINGAGADDYFVFESGTDTFSDWDNGVITTGDIAYDSTNTEFFLDMDWTLDEDVRTDDASGATGGQTPVLAAGTSTYYDIPAIYVKGYSDPDFTTQLALPTFGSYEDSTGTLITAAFVVQSLAGALNQSLTVVPSLSLPANEIKVVYSSSVGKVDVGDYLVATELGPNGESRLTKITKIAKEGITPNQVLHIYCDQEIKITQSGTVVERYKDIESVIDAYKLFALNGFVLNPNYHSPNGTQDRLDVIMNDTIGPDTNLFKALIDKDAISYRYIVDSFGLGIQPQSKYQLSYLAKARQNAFAILNAPSMQDFKDSTDPRFTDLTGSVQARLISTGGDLTLNPTMVYGLPSISNGSNYSGFFAPYLVIRDRGKNITVPPAGTVSNNFIDKYANALPWSIVAGPRRGVLSGRGLIGLETNFDKEDRDYIEPFGLNPIIFQRGVGIEIHGNKTAQQNIKSALSSIHVREVLIYIQDGIAAILKNYLFEFNTAQTRLEIKTLADNFMFSVKRDNGVYDFKNVMDTTNNTPDVIDANMGILDTYVEPVKGLEILIHRTTILRTGAIATGQFS
jgi:hypothetical protein